MIVMDAVVDGVLELHGDVTPARELVVVDLGPVITLDQDSYRRFDAVATVLLVVFHALVRVLGWALSPVGADNSQPCE